MCGFSASFCIIVGCSWLVAVLCAMAPWPCIVRCGLQPLLALAVYKGPHCGALVHGGAPRRQPFDEYTSSNSCEHCDFPDRQDRLCHISDIKSHDRMQKLSVWTVWTLYMFGKAACKRKCIEEAFVQGTLPGCFITPRCSQ